MNVNRKLQKIQRELAGMNLSDREYTQALQISPRTAKAFKKINKATEDYESQMAREMLPMIEELHAKMRQATVGRRRLGKEGTQLRKALEAYHLVLEGTFLKLNHYI